MRSEHVFLGALLFCLIIQAIYWHHFDVVDEIHWLEATEGLMTLSPEMFDPFTAGYPGTPPMLLAIAMHWIFGVPLERAFYGALTLLVAGSGALCTWICYRLRPRLLWWLTAAALLVASPLYLRATPPSVIVIPLVSLLFLLTFYIYELRSSFVPRWVFVLMGITIGVAVATRLDTALFFSVMQLLWLFPVIGWRAAAYTFLIAFLTFFLTNPFMWFFPIMHLSSFLQKVLYHYSEYQSGVTSLLSWLKISPFAWLGFIYAVILWVWQQGKDIISRRILANLLIATLFFVLILLSSRYQPPWYFFPLVLLWELFFLLFVVELISRASHTLGFTEKSIVSLYLLFRLGLFVLLLFRWSPALYFFTV